MYICNGVNMHVCIYMYMHKGTYVLFVYKVQRERERERARARGSNTILELHSELLILNVIQLWYYIQNQCF